MWNPDNWDDAKQGETSMSDDARFWDRIARRYAEQPVKDQTSYERTLERTRAHLDAGDRVLEVGCGTGSTALTLAGSVACLIASDISPEMIAIAGEKAQAAGVGNVDFVCSDIAGHVGRGERYDAVLAFNLLHLLRDPEGEVTALGGLVRPGGLFISKTVCLAEAGWYLRPVVWVMRLIGKAPHVRFFRIAELEALIAGAGFEIVETGTYPASPPSRFVVATKS